MRPSSPVPRLLALCYYVFFTLSGSAGIALAVFAVWDWITHPNPELTDSSAVIAACVLMIGFSIYGLFYRKRYFQRVFGGDPILVAFGSNSRSLNVQLGGALVAIGILGTWLSGRFTGDRWVIPIGMLSWGAVQVLYGLTQPANRKRTAKREP